MHFAQPQWFFVLAVVMVAMPLFFVFAHRQRRAALARFALHPFGALSNSVSEWRRVAKALLVTMGSIALILALARPEWGSRDEERTSRGIDLVFAIDTSRSMLARDAHPDRLTRAKMAIADLVAKFPGNRVGLVAFAGRSFLSCPLTLDRQAFDESLAALDTNTITRGGTNISAAIETAADALGTAEHSNKVLVLLTDGENLEDDALASAKRAAAEGLHIFTVGVGSTTGELIPIAGKQEFLRDADGNYVKSRLDEQMLGQIASLTGGSYEALGENGQGLERLYQEHLSTLPVGTLGSRSVKVYRERFEWPLALALLCFALEPLVGERKRRWVFSRFSRRAGALAAGAFLFAFAHVAQASAWSASQAYDSHDYKRAKKEFAEAAAKKPERGELAYDAGVASYRDGDFKTAADAFKSATSDRELTLQEKAYYDLANSQYRLGQATEKDNREATMVTWKQAIADYEAALALDGKDADAIYNRDFVKKRLAELEKQQPPKPPPKDDPAKKDQSQKDQQSKNDKSQGGTSSDLSKGGEKKNGGQQDAAAKPKDGKGVEANSQPQSSGQPQAGDQPDGNKAPDAAQKKNEAGPEDGNANGQDSPRPGELSRAEAKALLDSFEGEDRHFAPALNQRSGQVRQQDSPKKDW